MTDEKCVNDGTQICNRGYACDSCPYNRNEYVRKKLDEIKRKTRPVDAMPLIKAMLDNRNTMTSDDKKKFIDVMKDSFEKTALLLLDRCFTEGLMTEVEYFDIKEKYHLEYSDFCTVLQAYFSIIDGFVKKGDKCYLATVDDSNIYKCKEFIFQRFGVDVKSVQECIEIMEKDKGVRGTKVF
jgi:hypothetical protein